VGEVWGGKSVLWWAEQECVELKGCVYKGVGWEGGCVHCSLACCARLSWSRLVWANCALRSASSAIACVCVCCLRERVCVGMCECVCVCE